MLIEGVFEKRRFLSLLRDFIVFGDVGGALVRKMAGYHQFHAVEAAVGETLRAATLQQESGGSQRRAAVTKPAGSRAAIPATEGSARWSWHHPGLGEAA